MRPLSCLLLGEEPLVAHCADILRQREHPIVGIVSASAIVRRWCEEHAVPVIARADYPRFLDQGVDVLFSITHPALIAPDNIAKARVAAVNYHDGPLPRYAGINGSAWALLRGEAAHAVVFHHLTAGIDAGEILERRDVQLDPRETSVSLNMKNAALALDAFGAVLARLERGDLSGTPQRTDIPREIFSRHDRPAALCTLDFGRPAAELDRLVRACSFGAYPNRFGLAKIAHAGRAVVVHEAVREPRSGAPGTLLELEPDAWHIACGSESLRVKRFSDLRGAPLSANAAAMLLGVSAGDALRDDARFLREGLTRAAAEAEPPALNALRQRTPLALAFATSAATPGSEQRVGVELPAAFTARFAEQPADALIASYAVVLSALTHEEAFDLALVDGPARAPLAGTESLFFPATPLRVVVEPKGSFRSLLESVAAARARLAKHPGFLNDLIARQPALAEQADLARGELSAAAVSLETAEVPPGAALTLCIRDHSISLVSDGRVDPERLSALASELLCVARRVAADPEVSIDGVDLLDDRQLHQQVFAWNDTARTFPADLQIHDAFERQAARRPEAVALVCAGHTKTFAEVDRAANRVANALRRRNIGPGDHVAVLIDRGFELVTAILGVAKSGAAYVPIDVGYPDHRIRFMLEDADCSAILASARYSEHLPAALALFVDGPELAAESDAAVPCRSRADDVCYIIYTSGSTGQPKGVVLQHRAVVNTLDWVNRTYEVGEADRLLFVTSPSFDLSVYDIFGALGAGASVEIAPDELLREPEALAQRLCAPGITIWDSAPPALARLIPFLPEQAPASTLRRVMLSGDWIPVWLPPRLQQTFRGVLVESLGGATEAAIWSNYFHVREVDPTWTSIPYGYPIQNARYYVLDRRMRPAPAGIPGELYIGGACLARGYHERAELNRQRFLPDPFRAGERIYKTGDLARYWADGTLEFLGRADFQVKIRGYRVELGEVEHAVATLPAVREAVCSTYTDSSGQKSLVAYVVPSNGAPLDEQALRDTLGRALPEYMVPSHVVSLKALPLSSNGKIDRKALPNPTLRDTPSDYVAPRTELERELVALWERLLQKNPIGVSEDFFALGGHSLLAVMLVTEIKKQLGIDVPLSRVLENPTIERFAAAVAECVGPERRSHHLLSLNARGSRPPLVLVAGVGGYAFTYRNFPELLGADQPVFTFQAVGADDTGELVDHSIEDMARIYEPELLQACPRGPIVLGGFSFGILPAFELARRLIESGREVPLLISFDGFAPCYPEPLPLPHRLLAHARELFKGPEARREYLRERAENIRARVMTLLGRADELAPTIPFADPRMSERMRRLWVIHVNARNSYRPTFRLPCDLLLIKAAVQETWVATKMDDPFYGWSNYVTGGVSVLTVPGTHLALFDPPTQPLIAEAISSHIRRYVTRRSSRPPRSSAFEAFRAQPTPSE